MTDSFDKINPDKIEAGCGINKKNSETIREYYKRVGEETGVDPEKTSDVVEIVNKLMFGPKEELSDNELEILDEFIEEIETEAGDSEKATSSEGQTKTEPDSGLERSITTDNSNNKSDNNPDIPNIKNNKKNINHPNERTFSENRFSFWYPSTAENLADRFDIAINSIQNELRFLIPIIISGVLTFYWNLGTAPLRRWDETLYANIAQDMVSHGNWLIPHLTWGGSHGPFLEKFPLLYWFEAISLIIFGQTEFAARLPSAIFAILSAIMLYFFARDLFDRQTGLISSIMFMIVPYVYAGLNAGRQGSQEMGLLFFGISFLYLTYKYIEKESWYWAAGWGIAGGLAVLAKGTAAGIFVIIALPIIIGYWRKFLRPQAFLGVGLTAVIALPWPVYVYATHPNMFYNQLIGTTLGRALGTGSVVCRPGTTFDFMCYPYIRNVWIHADPIIYPAIIGSLYLLYTLVASNSARIRAFLLWWAGVVFIFFTFTGNHAWYLIPMYPAMCVLAGKLVYDSILGEWIAKLGIATSLCFILLFSPRLTNLPLAPFKIEAQRFVAMYNIKTGMIYLTTVLLFSTIVFFYDYIQDFASQKLTNDDINIANYIVPTVMCLLLVGLLIGLPPAAMGGGDKTEQSKTYGQQTQDVVPSGSTVYVSDSAYYDGGPMLVWEFYADRKIRIVGLNTINSDSSTRYAVISSSQEAQLSREHNIIINATNTRSGDWLLVRTE